MPNGQPFFAHGITHARNLKLVLTWISSPNLVRKLALIHTVMAYAEYIEAAFKTDYILGNFWCYPLDSPKGFEKEGVKQVFFNNGLSPRPGLHQSVQEVNKMI